MGLVTTPTRSTLYCRAEQWLRLTWAIQSFIFEKRVMSEESRVPGKELFTAF